MKKKFYVTRDKEIEHQSNCNEIYGLFCGKPKLGGGDIWFIGIRSMAVCIASFTKHSAKLLGINLKPGEIKECFINIKTNLTKTERR